MKPMMNKPSLKCLVFALLVITFGLTMPVVASAGEQFYWRDSYGRGGGAPMSADCGSKEYDAGLCYTPCKSGYHGVGPGCYENGGIGSYDRGIGTVPPLGCGNKEYDGGLCYTGCATGFHGVGPVCWGNTPSGYVDCGAGFATSKLICAQVVSAQVIAAGMLALWEVPAAEEGADAAKQVEMGPENVEKAKELDSLMEPLLTKLRPIFDDMASGAKDMAQGIEDVKAQATDYLFGDSERADKVKAFVYLYKFASGAGSATAQALQGPEGVVDDVRLITTITGIVDPTPLSGLISAYAYPVYTVPHGSAYPTGGLDWNHWAYIYAVDPAGKLRYWRFDGDSWGAEGIIGQDWGDMKFVTAGSDGELFAVSNQGDLYFYKHDSQMKWVVSGLKIGNGWNWMTNVLAGGTEPNGDRLLYGIEAGTLKLYRFSAGDHPTLVGAPEDIGWYWTPEHVTRAFAGANGVVYAIAPGPYTPLERFPFGDFETTPHASNVGWEWGSFERVFGGPYGAVFAITRDGTLLLYSDPGNGHLLKGPKQIGVDWRERLVTAMKSW